MLKPRLELSNPVCSESPISSDRLGSDLIVLGQLSANTAVVVLRISMYSRLDGPLEVGLGGTGLAVLGIGDTWSHGPYLIGFFDAEIAKHSHILDFYP